MDSPTRIAFLNLIKNRGLVEHAPQCLLVPFAGGRDHRPNLVRLVLPRKGAQLVGPSRFAEKEVQLVIEVRERKDSCTVPIRSGRHASNTRASLVFYRANGK
eukprot:3356140-Pleurochrysis_carterae.AAC.1